MTDKLYELRFGYIDGSECKPDRSCILKDMCIPGYSVELISDKDENNASLFYIKLKNIDKTKKIISVEASFNIEYNTENVLVHKFFDSQVMKTDKMKDGQLSEYFLSLFDNKGIGTTFLSKTPCKFKSEMKLSRAEKGVNVSLITYVPYSFEGDIFSEAVYILEDTLYTEALAYNASIDTTSKNWENVIGWGSWDYYYTSIDDAGVRENVDFIAKDEVLREKVKYIAIDDGWQQNWGDWREGWRFRDGLEKTVEYIEEKGFSAGIWIAPILLYSLSGTVMRRNDFLIRDSFGDPVVDGVNYILDPTHPDGQKFLRETFSYLKSKGFKYYKLDYLENIVLYAERFYDKSCGHFDALRIIVKLARECLGDDVHIMGCNVPYGYGGGDFDSRRTGPDIHNTQKHLLKGFENFYPQFASHRKIYNNDLDYLIVRGEETSCDEQINVINSMKFKKLADNSIDPMRDDRKLFNYEDAKFLCNTILMSGSTVMMSDRLSRLNEKGLELVRKTVAYADFDTAVPVGDVSVLPQVWYKAKNGAYYIFNFTCEEKVYTIEAHGAYEDIFTGKEYISENGVLKINLKGKHSISLYKK